MRDGSDPNLIVKFEKDNGVRKSTKRRMSQSVLLHAEPSRMSANLLEDVLELSTKVAAYTASRKACFELG